MRVTSFPGGVLLGAGLMYFLDPIRGRRRRARIKEAVTHAERRERELLEKAARDASNRAHGLVERVKHPPSPDAPDPVIESRVRACLGRAVSHPGALDVSVDHGRVIVRGPIFAHEAEHALRAIRRVPGVRELVDRMERHQTAGTISSLQGPGHVRRAARRRTWSPTAQIAATGAGGALVLYGWLVRGGSLGKLLAALGGLLALRGAVNKPLPELIARSKGVTVQKTIFVQRPLHDVFELWSRLDNFPLFMEHVRSVEVHGDKSTWTVDGPAGSRVQFQAQTTKLEPDRVIAWKTLANQPIEHEGRVRFEPADSGTRVHVLMTYRPPGGVAAHALAHILGWDPKARLDDDLIRMKALLEEGRTRAHQHRAELADLH